MSFFSCFYIYISFLLCLFLHLFEHMGWFKICYRLLNIEWSFPFDRMLNKFISWYLSIILFSSVLEIGCLFDEFVMNLYFFRLQTIKFIQIHQFHRENMYAREKNWFIFNELPSVKLTFYLVDILQSQEKKICKWQQ